MPSIKRIDHIAIIVEHIEESLEFWRDTLGLDLSHIEDVPDQQSIVAFLPTGDTALELLQSTTEQGVISKFINKRGQGVHHITFEVDDIQAELDRLKHNGINLINEKPYRNAHDELVAFIHPKSTYGILIELLQKDC